MKSWIIRLRPSEACRESSILSAYHFKDEVRRRTESAEFTKRAEIGEPDLTVREEPHVYLGKIDRQLRSDLGALYRWGEEDKYGNTRKPNKGKYGGKGKWRDSRKTIRADRSNYRCVNCAEWEDDPVNGNDFGGDWGTSDYKGSACKSGKID